MLLRHVDSGADSDLQEERDSLRTHNEERGGGRSFGETAGDPTATKYDAM